MNEDEENDEVVKAIIKSKENHRNHPPSLILEDAVMDICFHPISDLIVFAMVTGDILL